MFNMGDLLIIKSNNRECVYFMHLEGDQSAVVMVDIVNQEGYPVDDSWNKYLVVNNSDLLEVKNESL